MAGFFYADSVVFVQQIITHSISMAKRRGALSSVATRNKKHPHKTKKRLAIKAAMLATRKKRS